MLGPMPRTVGCITGFNKDEDSSQGSVRVSDCEFDWDLLTLRHLLNNCIEMLRRHLVRCIWDRDISRL